MKERPTEKKKPKGTKKKDRKASQEGRPEMENPAPTDPSQTLEVTSGEDTSLQDCDFELRLTEPIPPPPKNRRRSKKPPLDVVDNNDTEMDMDDPLPAQVELPASPPRDITPSIPSPASPSRMDVSSPASPSRESTPTKS